MLLFDIGEKPGKGHYRCTVHRDEVIYLPKDSDPLPPCPHHIHGEKNKWEKVS